MNLPRSLSSGLVAWLVSGTLLGGSPTVATNLVTGNGFGFAVVSPEAATITKVYAHPYSFSRPDPRNPLGEGIETANFIKSLRFPCRAEQGASAQYQQGSHVIGVRCYRRVRSNYIDPAIFEYWYERQEFLFVDLSLAEVDRRLGRNVEAAALVKRIVDKAAADHNLIPEMYVAVPCQLFP